MFAQTIDALIIPDSNYKSGNETYIVKSNFSLVKMKEENCYLGMELDFHQTEGIKKY